MSLVYGHLFHFGTLSDGYYIFVNKPHIVIIITVQVTFSSFYRTCIQKYFNTCSITLSLLVSNKFMVICFTKSLYSFTVLTKTDTCALLEICRVLFTKLLNMSSFIIVYYRSFFVSLKTTVLDYV